MKLSIFGKFGKKAAKNIPPMKAAEALDGFKALVEASKDNHRITEEEITKRKKIKAEKEISIEEIRAKKEILLNYFDNVFRERREIYQGFFERLDKGIETGNMELIQIAASSIVNVALDSPLKDLQKFQMNNSIGKEVEKIDNFEI
jgi:hypothetical protein